MTFDLLRAVQERLSLVKEFDRVPIRVSTNARFDKLVEGKPEVAVHPISRTQVYETRDVVKETTVVSVAIAEYFGDKFDELEAYNLLDLAPAVEAAFLGVDLPIKDEELYRWESSQTLATPFNNVIKDIPGGSLDVDAADEAYIFQVPVLITYARYLKTAKLPTLALRDMPNDIPRAIYAPDELRLSLTVAGELGTDLTSYLYKLGLLVFK